MTKSLFCSLLALIGLVVFGIQFTKGQSPNASSSVWTLPSPAATGNEAMLMHSGITSSGANQVILVDSTRRVLAVYAIAPDTGVIQLKSVRNLAADFQLEEFNGSDPSPAKVRGILNQHP
ncbi:MAG: hypothetical protein SGI77_21310 [Pirellulaceae bacterium]|nr:hypothetical protein [Pirellulaceae bacterium]